MKELSIEEKAKRYDEAIDKAKKELDACGSQDCDAARQIFRLFSELIEPEDEDERIRKGIIKYLEQSQFGEEHYCVDDDIVRDYIAWLEKQGEPIDINPSEFDLHLNKLLKQFETLPKEELASSLSFYLNVVQNDGTYREEKQGEQKPQRMISAEAKEAMYGKPTAWGEEDEQITLSIEQVMNCASLLNIVPEKTDKIRTWLKSLRPQNTWKPSDEQMEVLEALVEDNNQRYFYTTLNSLYEQLKKLREE